MWIQTHTGKKFDFANITSNEIDIRDIAHALSHIVRFNGHITWGYTVAQHCCHISDRCIDYKLEGLLHDAHEAYIGDVSRPLKQFLGPAYRDWESMVWVHVAKSLGIDVLVPDEVKMLDQRMLATEARDLFAYPPLGDWTQEYGLPFPSFHIKFIWPPELAKAEFLNRYNKLTGKLDELDELKASLKQDFMN